MINNVGIKTNADVNIKIDYNRIEHKGRCDTWFIWNPSNCEFECDKSCDIGQYLDYKNCKCRKELISKLVAECN